MAGHLASFFIILFLTPHLFAENLNGIFGIPFGTTQVVTKNQMQNKGWSISKEKDNAIVFKKAFGTYANVITNNIEITFFKDKLYEVEITFGFAATDDEIFQAFNILKEHYNLVYMSQASRKYEEGLEVHEINFCDSEINRFQYIEMSNKNNSTPSMRQFVITSCIVNEQKRKFEEQQETKNILSDS